MIKTWIVITTEGIVVVKEESESSACMEAILQFEYPESVRVLQAWDTEAMPHAMII
jgi:hypothetical protein